MPTDTATLSDADLQGALAELVREYARRADEQPFPAFAPGNAVTATEAMITVSAILSAAGLQLFELGMWQAWAGRS